MEHGICDQGFINECTNIMKKFISTDSCQPQGNEAEMVKAILSYFPEGVTKQIFNHGENRSSLVITIPGENHEDALAFIGHIDTVATGNPKAWSYPPLEGYLDENGVIHGRGTADMKGGVTAMTVAALSILASGKKPRTDLLFCFTADEEKDGTGIKTIVESGILDKVSRVIIAEPSESRPGLCEKGALWLRLKTHGISSHGSRPEIGVNAIEALMDFERVLREKMDITTKHKLLGRSSLSVTRINGGIMTNIIPDEATMEIDIRTIPIHKNKDILQYARESIKQICEKKQGLTIELEVLNDRPSVETEESHELICAVKKILTEYGLDSTPKGIYFYTDMSQVAPKIDAPFVILGPGDDKLAHQVNEYNKISDVENIIKVYIKFIQKYYMGE